jgi:hypothetical protein
MIKEVWGMFRWKLAAARLLGTTSKTISAYMVVSSVRRTSDL